MNGFSGLHMAVAYLQPDVAQLLLERGHEVNAAASGPTRPVATAPGHGSQWLHVLGSV